MSPHGLLLVYSLYIWSLKHQLEVKKKQAAQKNTLAGRPFSYLEDRSVPFPSPSGDTQRCPDMSCWVSCAGWLSCPGSSEELPAHLGPTEKSASRHHTAPSGPCLPLRPRATQLSMRTSTCREGQKILLHQTLHLLTVQLDQAVVEPRARLLPNVNDVFLRWDAGLPGILTAMI